MKPNDLVALYRDCGPILKLYVRLRAPLISLDTFHHLMPDHPGCIVDLGCGYGLLANSLAMAYPDWQVIGIDLQATRIAEARKTIRGRTNVEFRVGDARAYLGQADVVLMADFLHHLKVADQDSLLESVYTQLRPGGLVVILDVATRPWWKFMMSWLADWVFYPLDEKNHIRSSEEIIRTLESIGYQVEVFDRPASIFAGIGYACIKPG